MQKSGYSTPNGGANISFWRFFLYGIQFCRPVFWLTESKRYFAAHFFFFCVWPPFWGWGGNVSIILVPLTHPCGGGEKVLFCDFLLRMSFLRRACHWKRAFFCAPFSVCVTQPVVSAINYFCKQLPLARYRLPSHSPVCALQTQCVSGISGACSFGRTQVGLRPATRGGVGAGRPWGVWTCRGALGYGTLTVVRGLRDGPAQGGPAALQALSMSQDLSRWGLAQMGRRSPLFKPPPSCVRPLWGQTVCMGPTWVPKTNKK